MSNNYGMMCPHGYGPTRVKDCPACKRTASNTVLMMRSPEKPPADPLDKMKASMVNARFGALAGPTVTPAKAKTPPAAKKKMVGPFECTVKEPAPPVPPGTIMIPIEARRMLPAAVDTRDFDREFEALKSHVRDDERALMTDGTPLPATYHSRMATLDGMARARRLLLGALLVSLVACGGSTVEVTTVGHDPGVLAPYGDDRVFGGYRNEICTQLGLFACDAACYADTEEWIQCRMDWQTTCAGRATTGIVVVPASGQWPFDACADALAQRACASDPRAVPAACTWIVDQGR